MIGIAYLNRWIIGSFFSGGSDHCRGRMGPVPEKPRESRVGLTFRSKPVGLEDPGREVLGLRNKLEMKGRVTKEASLGGKGQSTKEIKPAGRYHRQERSPDSTPFWGYFVFLAWKGDKRTLRGAARTRIFQVKGTEQVTEGFKQSPGQGDFWLS